MSGPPKGRMNGDAAMKHGQTKLDRESCERHKNQEMQGSTDMLVQVGKKISHISNLRFCSTETIYASQIHFI